MQESDSDEEEGEEGVDYQPCTVSPDMVLFYGIANTLMPVRGIPRGMEMHTRDLTNTKLDRQQVVVEGYDERTGRFRVVFGDGVARLVKPQNLSVGD